MTKIFFAVLFGSFVFGLQKPSMPHQPTIGDFNGDGKPDSAYFVPAHIDSSITYITDGPDPWRFYCLFSDPAIDTIPVHYKYDLHTIPDLNRDGADELMLHQPVASYYRVMSYNKSQQRWNELLTVPAPKNNHQPTRWISSRNDTLFFITNRSFQDLRISDSWESTSL